MDVRPDVTWEHSVSGTDHMIELASDCYRPVGCGSYRRRLFLSGEGSDLRGEDRLDTVGNPPEFALRFHLHPSVRVELEETDILLHAGDEVWSFRSDGYSTIEDSIYFGFKDPAPTQQIVVRPAEVMPIAPAVASDSQPAPNSSLFPDTPDDAVVTHPAQAESKQADLSSSMAGSVTDQDRQDQTALTNAIETGIATGQEKDPVPPAQDSETETAQMSDSEPAPSDGGGNDVSGLDLPVPPPEPPVLANAIRWAFTRLDA